MSKDNISEFKNQGAQFQLLFEANGKNLLTYNVRLDHFNYQLLRSEQLFYTLRNCVRLVKDDLVSKSRIYSHLLINRPMKLTGFKNAEETTYFYDSSFEEHTMPGVTSSENNEPKTFKFTFTCNGKPSFEEIFDVTHIPDYVIDKFNPLNQLSEIEFMELVKLDFQASLNSKMQLGKESVIHRIISDINEVAKDFVN